MKVKLVDKIKEIKFSEVTLEDKGKATVTAAFSKGTSIELRVENGIIVAIPSYQKGKIRGLIRKFNGDHDPKQHGHTYNIPYSGKFGRELNMAVWRF